MSQFILTIKIVLMRDDDITRILRRMASGTVIAHSTLEATTHYQKEFHDMASTVITGLKGRPENYYGFSVIVDEKERTVLQRTIMDLEMAMI